MTTRDDRIKANEDRCKETALTAAMQYRACLDIGLDREEARIFTAAVLFGAAILAELHRDRYGH